MTANNRLLILLLLPFLIRCATVGQPSGGDIDEEPPTLVSTQPDSFATYFQGGRLVYYFDEFFVLEKAEQSVLISPPLSQSPVFSIKKKSLIVDIPDDLKPNTTYQINFGESIRDLNESNILQDFKMVFSTGPYIDSLMISGVVMDAATLEPMEDISLMLFPDSVDSALITSLPYYFSRTDEIGHGDLDFLTTGQYQFFALEDKNGNYFHDPNEMVAFLDSMVFLPEDTNQVIQFRMFLPEADSLIFRGVKKAGPGHFTFFFNLPVDTFSVDRGISWTDTSQSLIGFNTTRDTIDWYFYPPPGDDDTGKYLVRFNDQDTSVRVGNFGFRRQGRDRGLAIRPSAQGGRLELGASLFLISNRPILTFEEDSVVLLEDSIPIDFTIEYANEVRTRLQVRTEFKEGKEYKIVIPRGTMESIAREENDSVEFTFQVPLAEEYGNIATDLILSDSQQVIVQLIKNEAVARDRIIQSSQSVSFKLLVPGNYKLQAIIDTNENGKWDTGSLKKRRQPERVIILEPALNVRANWDLLDLQYTIDLNGPPVN
ncbi:MAG: Ig-like domain-containing protein [Bacteroidia bacterium]